MSHFWKASIVALVIIAAVLSYPMAPNLTCSLCPPGTHEKRACSARSNTTCRPCSKGTFSDVPTNSKTCTVCSTCPQGAYVNKPCTVYSDTVCFSCSRPPSERSDHYEMSCENSDPEVTDADLFDLMISDDPSDTKPSSGGLKGGNVPAKNHIKSEKLSYFIGKTNNKYVKQNEIRDNDNDANDENVLNVKSMNNGKYSYKQNYFYKGDNFAERTEEYNRKKVMEDTHDEKRTNIDVSYNDEKKLDEDGFVNDEVKLYEVVDDGINDRVERDVEDVQKAEDGAETADSINKDGDGKQVTDVDMKEETSPVSVELDNKNTEDKHEDEEKKDDVVEEGNIGNGVADDVTIDDINYSAATDAGSHHFDVDKENGGKNFNMLPMEPTVQVTLPQLSSETNAEEDEDEVGGRLGFVQEEPVPTPTFEDGSKSQVDPGTNKNSANGDNAQNESSDTPTNSNAELETAHPVGSPIGQNEFSSQPTTAQLGEIVEDKDVGLHEDLFNEEVMTTVRISEFEDKQYNESTKSPTMLAANVSHFFYEGRLEAVKAGLDDKEYGLGDNSTSQLPDDILAAKLDTHDVSNHQDGNTSDASTEVSTEQSTKQPRKLPELEIDFPNNGSYAGDEVSEDGAPKVGKAHVEDNEDALGRRRAIIILCVSVGGVAFFTLIFIATRCWKRRRRSGHFKEMKKVSNTEAESVQLRSLNQPQRDNHDETSTNGLYRNLPDGGQPSSKMPKKEPEMEKTPAPETASTMAPLLAYSPANENEPEPKSSPPREPLISSLEKLKYIDDSTDDEYVNVQSSRLMGYRLSKVAEETPPTSPSFKQ